MNQNHQALYREATEMIRQGKPGQAAQRLQSHLSLHPGDEVAASILGSALLQDGQTAAAMTVFEKAVADHAASWAAHGDLGFARLKSGDTKGAGHSFQRAVELNDRFYQGWCFLSRLKHEAGDLPGALKALRRADDCDPFGQPFAEIQAAMSASQFAQAEKIARNLLARQPGYPRAAYTLAHLAGRVGAHLEAAKILRYALEHHPADINLRAALVNSCEETGDYDEALVEARHITELDPGSFAAWQILGRIHGHRSDYQDSLAAYDRALQCSNLGEKDAGNLNLIRGHALKILGRHEESTRSYRQATNAPEVAGAGWWGLADMKTFRFDDSDIAAMTALVQDATAPAAQRSQAAFALGKALEDAKSYDKAFNWYQQANRLRPDVDYDAADYDRAVDTLIETFTPEFLARGTSNRSDGPTPIFIVGLPRSGSTLIEQILASHSQVEGTMELVNLPNVLRQITIDGGRRKLDYPASLGQFSQEELAAYGQAYIDSTAIYRSGKPYFIDKMPPNFDKVGLLHMILPRAIIIDARRHPMDCGFSCFKQHFAGGHYFSYDLGDIGAYYNSYLKIMDHWDRVLPGKVACIQYEDMVADTEATVRRLLDHCGLPWEDTCLRFFDNQRPVRTASSEQVRQPIYKKAVAHWKHFECQLEPLANALGEQTLKRFERF